MRKVSTTSAKALEASYAASLLVAKAKKPSTIICEDMLPPPSAVELAEKLQTVCLSEMRKWEQILSRKLWNWT